MEIFIVKDTQIGKIQNENCLLECRLKVPVNNIAIISGLLP